MEEQRKAKLSEEHDSIVASYKELIRDQVIIQHNLRDTILLFGTLFHESANLQGTQLLGNDVIWHDNKKLNL